MKAVILCAGEGTRMGLVGQFVPKPLLKVNGKSLLQRWFEYFKKHSVDEFFINTFHLAEMIEKYVGDGSRFGVKVHRYRQPGRMGTASVLKKFGLENEKEPFFVVFGDSMMTMDLSPVIKYHNEKNAEVTLLGRKHHEPWRKGVLTVDENARVTHIVEKPDIKVLAPNQYCISSIAVINPSVVLHVENDMEWLGEQFYPKLVGKGVRMFFYERPSDDRTGDINKSENLKELEATLRKVEGAPKTDVVFIDRDGTMNVRSPEGSYALVDFPFVLFPYTIPALKKLKEAGKKVVMITNQACIGKGHIKQEAVEKAHKETFGELIDNIYICPHIHGTCTCRKPHPGLFFKAFEELNIDPDKAVMIGDTEYDEAAALGAGVSFIKVDDTFTLLDAVNQVIQA